jgi:hypothetical protein
MPPVFPPAIPSIDYGARLRTALLFQNPEDPEKFNDVGEFLEGDIYMSGQIHRYWSWQFSLTFSYPGRAGTSNLAPIMPLDVIGKFEPIPEFNVWVGRMLVQADRFTPSGPWGIDEFFYPGFFPFVGPPALPKAGPVGRDVGTTVWGAPFGGHFKYYLGAYQLQDPALSPLLSGRLQVSLLSPEPAFFQRTTYYGTKDLISVGVGVQQQTDGSAAAAPPAVMGMPPVAPPAPDDYSSLTADLNVEKTFPGTGTVSLVGQYSKFEGDFNPWDNYWVASLGYMLPQVIGFGKVRATVRYQNATSTAPGAEASNLLDAQLSYIIAAWYARLGLGFRKGNTWLPGDAATGAPARTQPSNMIYLGLTLADP